MSVRRVDENVVVQYAANLTITNIACDCTGQFVVLCGQKLFAIVGLDSPKDLLKTLMRNSRHKVCAVQWNPHVANSHFFLTTSNQFVELWRWDASTRNSSHKETFKGHTRAVNDLDWSPTDINIAATCSVDTNTCIWDVRDFRRPSMSLQSLAYPSHIKWNHLRGNVLATTHEGDLKIWDIRKSNAPLWFSISALTPKVTGLDWSPFSDTQVTTCSEDGSVRFWDSSSQKQEDDRLQSNSAFWKIKYLPFGNGIVTGSSGGALCLWTLNRIISHQHRSQPLCVFGSHGGDGVIVDFCWRPVNSDFQLMSWSDEQSLRINQIDPLIKQFSAFPSSNSLESLCEKEKSELELKDASHLRSNKSSSSPRIRKRGQWSASGASEAMSPATVEHAKTLMQEFNLLNVSIPDITIEEMSTEAQTLTVRVNKGVHTVHLTMSFPSSYPNKVAPEFHLSEDTTLDLLVQQKLVENLQSTALQHVQYGRRCIEPCLWKLVSSLNTILHETRRSPEADASDLPMQELWSSFSTEKLRDENVPFPRISGARFCGPGFLVCFTRRVFHDVPTTNAMTSEQPKRKQSETGVTPRAMSALSEITQPTRIPSKATGIIRSHTGLARSLPLDSGNVPSVSQYYQLQDQKPQKSRNKSRSTITARDSKQEQNRSALKKNPVGPVIMYDLSCLQSVHKQLGENYVFDRRDPVSMCRKNAQVATSADRKDLVQVWSLAAVEVAQMLKSNGPPAETATPWPFNPFGQKLIKIWFDYYCSVRDVQTLAMLCCAFESVSPAKSLIPSSQQQLPQPASIVSKNSNTPLAANTEAYTCSLRIDAVNNNTDIASVRKMRRSNSWSEVTFDGVLPFSETSNVQDGADHMENLEKDDQARNAKLLNPSLSVQYDLFKMAYSNILHQWGQVKKRAELLDFVTNQHVNNPSDIFSHDPVSSLEVKDDWTGLPVPVFLVCALCHIRVKGVSSVCIVCGHGGHLSHMSDWFLSHVSCATGCGCECLYENSPSAWIE